MDSFKNKYGDPYKTKLSIYITLTKDFDKNVSLSEIVNDSSFKLFGPIFDAHLDKDGLLTTNVYTLSSPAPGGLFGLNKDIKEIQYRGNIIKDNEMTYKYLPIFTCVDDSIVYDPIAEKIKKPFIKTIDKNGNIFYVSTITSLLNDKNKVNGVAYYVNKNQ